MMTQINANTVASLTQIAELGRGRANHICWTVDGNWLAVAASTGIYLYKKGDWGTVRFFPADKPLYQIAVSADGRFIGAGSSEGTLHLWHLPTEKLITTMLVPDMSPQDQVRGLAFSKNGDQLAVGGSKGITHLYDIIDPSGNGGVRLSHKHKLGGSQMLIQMLDFSPDGNKVAGCDFSGQVIVWHTESGEIEITKKMDQGTVNGVRFSTDNKTVLFGGNHGRLFHWHVVDDHLKQINPPEKGHFGQITDLCITENGERLLSAARSALGLTNLIDYSYEAVDYPSQPHANTVGQPITSVAMTADQNHIAGVITGGRIFVIDRKNKQNNTVIDEHHHSVRGLTFAPSGDQLLVGMGITIGHPALWDISTKQAIQHLKHPTDELYGVYSMALSADGRQVAASCHDGHSVDIWDTESGEHRLNLNALGHDVKQITYSPNSRWLGAATRSGVQIWDTSTGEELYSVRKSDTIGFAFLPDGKHAISVDSENGYIWRLADGEILSKHTLSDDEDLIEQMALSADGKSVALITEWGLKLIETESWQLVLFLEEFESYPESISFNHDSTLLIVGYTDGTIQFLGLPDGQLVHQINHPSHIEVLAISADGRKLASGTRQGTVRVWQVPSSD